MSPRTCAFGSPIYEDGCYGCQVRWTARLAPWAITNRIKRVELEQGDQEAAAFRRDVEVEWRRVNRTDAGIDAALNAR